MKQKLISMTVLAVMLTCLLLVPVAYARPAYCDQAYGACKSSCGEGAFWVGLGGAIFGESVVGWVWGGGCYGGCWLGYAQCGG